MGHLWTSLRTLFFSILLYRRANSLPTSVYQKNVINSDVNNRPRDGTSALNNINSDGTCVTEDCKKISASIKAAINETVKPCDDFYEYACGEWIKNNPVPEGKLQISAFTELRDKNDEGMRNALVKEDSLSNLLPIKKLRTFFQSCLNVKAIDDLGNQPIKDYIKRLNSWAVDKTSGWNAKEWDVFDTLRKIQKTFTSTNLFFTVESVPDPMTKGTEDSRHILLVVIINL